MSTTKMIIKLFYPIFVMLDMNNIKVEFQENQVRQIHDDLRGSLLREPSDIEVEDAIKRIAQDKHPELAIIDFNIVDEPYLVTVEMV